MRTLARIAPALLLVVAGCGDVNSEEDARRAYLGIDAAVDKCIKLGFDGFNAAKSANIPEQKTTGTASGTLTVNGQVDQGSSDNKGMRLLTAFVEYSDDGTIKYASNAAALPKLDMQLKSYPNGTLTGTLLGNIAMSGELEGELALNLAFTGETQAGTAPILVERKPGTTKITGTATSKYGTYDVVVTR